MNYAFSLDMAASSSHMIGLCLLLKAQSLVLCICRFHCCGTLRPHRLPSLRPAIAFAPQAVCAPRLPRPPQRTAERRPAAWWTRSSPDREPERNDLVAQDASRRQQIDAQVMKKSRCPHCIPHSCSIISCTSFVISLVRADSK